MTLKQQYIAAGLPLLPSGRPNNYQLVKMLGRLGSRKDSTWIRDRNNHLKGHHSCCGSKRDYYHKVSCKAAAGDGPDDLSDFKDIV